MEQETAAEDYVSGMHWVRKTQGSISNTARFKARGWRRGWRAGVGWKGGKLDACLNSEVAISTPA